MTANSRWISVTFLALVVLPWLIYLPAVGGPFLFDDLTGILNNPDVHGFHALAKMVRFWDPSGVNYRPLRYLSFAADWTLGGGSPTAFHLMSILLHALCALLLWRLILRLWPRPVLAGLTALLFLVHPLQTEAVAYISGRKDLLCALFYLAALHCSLSAARSLGATRWAWSLLFFVSGAASFFAKEMALTLPVAVLLLDAAAVGEGRPWRWRLWESLRGRTVFYGAISLLGLLALVYKTVLMPATKIPFDLWTAPWRNTPLALTTVSLWVRKTLWPWPQLADFRGLFPRSAGSEHGWATFWNGGGVAATLIGLALLILVVVLARRREPAHRAAAVGGWAFFLVVLLPVSNLIPLNEPAAEHFLYLPLAGAALALAALAAPWLERTSTPGKALAVGVVLALAGLGVASSARAAAWRSTVTLWRSVLQVNDGSERAYNNYGLALLEIGDRQGAKEAFARALHRGPILSARAAANLMALQRADGQLVEAERTGALALSVHPDSPQLLSLQGGILLDQGQVEEAKTLLERVAQVRRGPTEAARSWRRDRGVAWLMSGDSQRSLALLREAAADDPADPSTWTNIGACLLALGRPGEAEPALRRALALPEASCMAHRNLAVALLEQGRAAEALPHLRQAAARGCSIPPSLAAAVEAASEAAAVAETTTESAAKDDSLDVTRPAGRDTVPARPAP